MTTATKKQFTRGIILRADDVGVESVEGELKVGATSKKLHAYLDGALRSVVTETQTQTLTNKTIDADLNTITNIENADIKAAAAIDATKIADGSVTNAEFQRISTVTSNVQDQLDSNATGISTVQTNLDNHLNDTANAHEASAISNTPSGNLAASDVQGALNELQSDIDTRATSVDLASEASTRAAADTAESAARIAADSTLQTNIDNHINDVAGAHAASAISNSPSGNLAATDIQGAVNELQSDIDTRATSASLTAHTGASTGVHGIAGAVVGTSDIQTLTAKTIVVASNTITTAASGNLAATELNSALAELQTDIDTRALDSALTTEASTRASADTTLQTNIDAKAAGAASSVDNHLARFDGATGKILQDGSTAVLSDAGALSGLTQLTVDDIDINGYTISSNNSAPIRLTPDTGAYIDVNGSTIHAAGKLTAHVHVDSSATGANAAITPNGKNIRLTSASLTSIDTITPSVVGYGTEITLINRTGNDVTINNDTGATAADRIYTGTGAAVTLKANAAMNFVYDGSTSRWNIVGGTGSGDGAGASVPDVFVQLTGTELLNTWTSGDNATFLGGGTLAGTFAYESSSPLNGTQSYKYTQAASSLDDYIASPVQDVPVRFRGNTATYFFPYTYDGGSSDIEPVLWDVTNGAKLTTSTNLLPSTGTNTSIYKVNVQIPSTCTQIRVGFHVKILNSGKILHFTDLQVSSDVTRYADPSVITDWTDYTTTTALTGGTTSFTGKWRRVGSEMEVDINATFSSIFTGGTPTFTLPSGYTINTSAFSSTPSAMQVKLGEADLVDVSVGTHFGGIFYNDSTTVTVRHYATINGNNYIASTSALSTTLPFTWANGDKMHLHFRVPISGWTASNPQIITASESFSTDTASLTYASSSSYTLSTLANAPVGTFITYTYAGGGNTRTQTTTAPTQTTSSMNTNGIQIFTRAHNASSTAGNPACVAIQIGKNYKGTSLTAYKTSGKPAETSSLDWYRDGIVAQGFEIKEYNPESGILILDGGMDSSTGSTTRTLTNSDATSTVNGSCYVTINASKSPALTGVPQVQPRIATIKDVKAAATDAGTFTSGAWQTRTLNTLTDDTGIVTSLASNQFTLSAGTYHISATAPAFRVNAHKAKLRNITDSTDTIIGDVCFNPAASGNTDVSRVTGTFTITSAKVFEIQHRCTTTSATAGLGRAENYSVDEVYTQVTLTKVK